MIMQNGTMLSFAVADLKFAKQLCAVY